RAMRARNPQGVECFRHARGVAAALLLTAGIGVAAPGPARAESASRAQLDALAQQVDRIESLREIEGVQRRFAQYAQYGQFSKMANLFASNGTLMWGDQTATGKKAIATWLTTDAGAMNGINPGSMDTTILDDPEINLSPDGQTAQGRWDG